ncbi:hypothetical protein EI94DRAFT_1430430, partial [Lactarius quietus]
DPLAAYARHSFADDQSYQAGLSTLYTTGALDSLSGEAKEDLLRKSRVFYFNQCALPSLTQTLHLEIHSPQSSRMEHFRQPEVPVARTFTFTELQALIEQGKTDEIPNNKHIPDALNDAPPSQSSAPQRKKPWEVASQ